MEHLQHASDLEQNSQYVIGREQNHTKNETLSRLMWLSHVHSPHMEIHTPGNPTVDVVLRVVLPNLEQGISELLGSLWCFRSEEWDS